uniref:Uncharacterized protein n=1 Tax=Siphoviridae sp. ctmP19 TaxID=2825651 RepID=A0A8S5PJA8_9CAUD|nr:MAG TPA: hypothetical protein [Siphoviridae sp. ctmP19]DAJ65002.1 MAG TPA: hypothetical protein [Caudoviricetes sp.]
MRTIAELMRTIAELMRRARSWVARYSRNYPPTHKKKQ